MKMDRRSVRSRALLRDALTQEIESAGIEHLTVSGLAERADVTRRTFYAHYKDVPELLASYEQELLEELAQLLEEIKYATIDDLYEALKEGNGYPGADRIFAFVKDHASIMRVLLGEKGDLQFQKAFKDLVYDQFVSRLMNGINLSVLGPIFDYYAAYAISAQLGIMQQWLMSDMKESPQEMARIATALMFARPGDLYGHRIEEEPFAILGVIKMLEGEFNHELVN